MRFNRQNFERSNIEKRKDGVAIAALRFGLLPLLILTSGCSSTIHKLAPVGGINSLSVDAKQRLVLVNENGGPNQNKRIVCAEPSPDALVAQSAALSANLTTPKAVGAALGVAQKESAGSIGLRTQTIQILRDGYYRICEAYQNGALKERQYRQVLLGVDSFIATVAAIETLGGTVAAPAIVLSPGGTSTSVNGNGATAGVTAGEIKLSDIKPAAGTLSNAQADAIAEVVANYLSYKLQTRKLRNF